MSALATTTFVILILFYQDRNSSIMSFRKQFGKENIPVTSQSSQKLMALTFCQTKTIKTPKPFGKHFKLQVKDL